MSVEVASLLAMFSADTSRFDSAVGKVQTGMTGLSAKVSGAVTSTGNKLTSAGVGMMAAFAPVAVALGSTVNGAMQFENSLTNIQAVTGSTNAETAALGQTLLDLGSSSVAGPQAVAAAYYDIAGGVTDANARMDVLNAAIATAEAGQADLGGTTSALISVMNSYASSNLEAGAASDVLTRTVGMGVGSMDQFASALPAVTGLAASLGISFEDVAGQMAFLTTKGYTASESATMLSGAMTALINPSGDMAAAIERAGYASGQAMIDALGLQGAYQAMADQGEDIAGITGNIEALRGVTALLGDDAPVFLEQFAGGVEGATEAARAIQLESPTAQFALMKSEIEGLSIQVGSALLPALNEIIGAVTPVVSAVADWAGKNPELSSTIGAIVIGLGAMGAAMMILGPIVTGLGTVLGLILSPLGLILVAAGAIGLAYKTNFLGFRDAVNDVAGAVANAWDKVKEFVGGLPGTLTGAVDSVGGAAASLGTGLFNGIVNVLSGLPAKIIELINQAIPDKINFGKVDLGGILGSVDLGSIDIPANPIPVPGRAGGGVVVPGQYYAANEVWAEGFTPLTAGKVSPMPRGGGQSGENVTIIIEHVSVQDEDPQRWLDRLAGAARMRGSQLVS